MVALSYKTYIAGISQLVKKILSGAYLAIIVFAVSQVQAAGQSVEVELGGKKYRIELALTAEERRRGLMGRESLADDEGMLLVYRHSGDHRIWMKNMLLPLRVYWLDESFSVIEMQRLEPCWSSPCPTYAAAAASRFVLELNDSDHALRAGEHLHGFKDLPL